MAKKKNPSRAEGKEKEGADCRNSYEIFRHCVMYGHLSHRDRKSYMWHSWGDLTWNTRVPELKSALPLREHLKLCSRLSSAYGSETVKEKGSLYKSLAASRYWLAQHSFRRLWVWRGWVVKRTWLAVCLSAAISTVLLGERKMSWRPLLAGLLDSCQWHHKTRNHKGKGRYKELEPLKKM